MLYIYVSYVIPGIQTIYLTACSLKLFAETNLLFAMGRKKLFAKTLSC